MPHLHTDAKVIHVPRGSADAEEIANSSDGRPIYLTDYLLTEDQAIDLAMVRLLVSEDKLFLERLREIVSGHQA